MHNVHIGIYGDKAAAGNIGNNNIEVGPAAVPEPVGPGLKYRRLTAHASGLTIFTIFPRKTNGRGAFQSQDFSPCDCVSVVVCVCMRDDEMIFQTSAAGFCETEKIILVIGNMIVNKMIVYEMIVIKPSQ